MKKLAFLLIAICTLCTVASGQEELSRQDVLDRVESQAKCLKYATSYVIPFESKTYWYSSVRADGSQSLGKFGKLRVEVSNTSFIVIGSNASIRYTMRSAVKSVYNDKCTETKDDDRYVHSFEVRNDRGVKYIVQVGVNHMLILNPETSNCAMYTDSLSDIDGFFNHD
jgi:DNA-directed RNA polymerase beta subunit